MSRIGRPVPNGSPRSGRRDGQGVESAAEITGVPDAPIRFASGHNDEWRLCFELQRRPHDGRFVHARRGEALAPPSAVMPSITSTAPIVRNVDRGAAIRIRAAIEATLREEGSYPSYDKGLIEADTRFRSAIHELVKDEGALVAEFDTIFPPAEPSSRRGGLAGGDLLEGSGMTKSARMHLVGMSGWLQGLIDGSGGRPA
jgi:hypothetical protein